MGRVLLLLAVFLIVLEGTCRVDDWVRYRMPIFSRVSDESELLVRDVAGMHGRPRTRFMKWRMNNIGTRGPDVTLRAPPGTLRVVTAGASETFGLYESPDREFPRQLEDSLRSRLPNRRVEVVNAAVFGMSLPTIEQDLRLRIAALHPDVVILYPTPVQYLTDEPPAPAAPDSAALAPTLPAIGILYPRSLDRLRASLKQMLPAWAANWLRERDVDAATREHPPGWQFGSVPQDRLADYDRDLRVIVGTIRRLGAVPLLVTHANAFDGPARDPSRLTAWERQYPRATGATLVAFDSAAALATLRVGRDSSVRVVNPGAMLPVPRAASFADYAHFTDAGASVLAGALAGAVLDLLSGDHGWLALHRMPERQS